MEKSGHPGMQGYYSGVAPSHEMYNSMPWQRQPVPNYQPHPSTFNAYPGYPPPIPHYHPPPPMSSHNQYMGIHQGVQPYQPSIDTNNAIPQQPQSPYYECYPMNSYDQQQQRPTGDSTCSFNNSAAKMSNWNATNHADVLNNNEPITSDKMMKPPIKTAKVNIQKFEKEQQESPVSSRTNTNSSIYGKPTPERQTYIITSDIKGLYNWNQHRNKINVVYEIYGVLDSAVVPVKGICRRFKIRTGKDTIDCVFYEIDRELGRIIRGQWVRCMGKLDAEGKSFTCVSVRPATIEEQTCQESMVNMCSEEMKTIVDEVKV